MVCCAPRRVACARRASGSAKRELRRACRGIPVDGRDPASLPVETLAGKPGPADASCLPATHAHPARRARTCAQMTRWRCARLATTPPPPVCVGTRGARDPGRQNHADARRARAAYSVPWHTLVVPAFSGGRLSRGQPASDGRARCDADQMTTGRKLGLQTPANRRTRAPCRHRGAAAPRPAPGSAHAS